MCYMQNVYDFNFRWCTCTKTQGTTVLDEQSAVPKLPPLTDQPIHFDKNELVRPRQRVAVLERAQSEKAQLDQAAVKFQVSSAMEADESASGVSL